MAKGRNLNMRIFKHTIKTKATLLQIWKLWEDVENWKTWDQEIEFSRSMRQVSEQTEVTFEVEVRGPLAFFYACMLRRLIKKKLPLEMAEMLKKAASACGG
jgi:hypothetical protein